MTASPIRVWGIGTSRTLRPIWLLHELGLEFELEPVLTRTPAMDTPAFRALSPRHKIPMLQDGDLTIGESAAIVLHLADRYRDRAAFVPPPGTRARSLHDELCWFVMTEMDALLYTIRRHEGLAGIYGASENAVEAARVYFLRSAAELERRLADGRPHLTGDTFTVADLLFKTCLDWAQQVCRIPIPASFDAYSKRLGARAAYRRAVETNFPPEVLATLGDDTRR